MSSHHLQQYFICSHLLDVITGEIQTCLFWLRVSTLLFGAITVTRPIFKTVDNFHQDVISTNLSGHEEKQDNILNTSAILVYPL